MRRLLRIVIKVCAVLVLGVFVINVVIYFTSRPHIYAGIDEAPTAQTVLVPGASVSPEGLLSPIFIDRLEMAIALYEAGKVTRVLVSGDNSTDIQNEVSPARLYLMERGVPDEAIFLDHAGFDTYSSMYRARDIFGVTSILISTQSFHLPWAVFVARRLGLEAGGVNADEGRMLFRNYVREVFANEKAVLNLIFYREPKYLGLPIPIEDDGVIYPPVSECLKDADCQSPKYVCQETQGTGTACPSGDPTCVPTHTIIAGECKVKKDNSCSTDSQCTAGNLCHKGACIVPVGRQCAGPSDTSCPTDFSCVQGCGPPVAREDDPPAPYNCQLEGYFRPCPICLAKDTLIDTPLGTLAVQDIWVGVVVWTTNKSGFLVPGVVVEVSKTPVPKTHTLVKLVLSDGRTLSVSPGHPTASLKLRSASTIGAQTVGELVVGDVYDGARVVTVDRVAYGGGYTYDLLPAGTTGFYFANGILLGSTLGH